MSLSMRYIFLVLVAFYVLTLGFVIAWEGHRKQLQTSTSALVFGGALASATGFMIHYFGNGAPGVWGILFFDVINVGSGLIASGYGLMLGGILLGLARLWKNTQRK